MKSQTDFEDWDPNSPESITEFVPPVCNDAGLRSRSLTPNGVHALPDGDSQPANDEPQAQFSGPREAFQGFLEGAVIRPKRPWRANPLLGAASVDGSSSSASSPAKRKSVDHSMHVSPPDESSPAERTSVDHSRPFIPSEDPRSNTPPPRQRSEPQRPKPFPKRLSTNGPAADDELRNASFPEHTNYPASGAAEAAAAKVAQRRLKSNSPTPPVQVAADSMAAPQPPVVAVELPNRRRAMSVSTEADAASTAVALRRNSSDNFSRVKQSLPRPNPLLPKGAGKSSAHHGHAKSDISTPTTTASVEGNSDFSPASRAYRANSDFSPVSRTSRSPCPAMRAQSPEAQQLAKSIFSSPADSTPKPSKQSGSRHGQSESNVDDRTKNKILLPAQAKLPINGTNEGRRKSSIRKSPAEEKVLFQGDSLIGPVIGSISAATEAMIESVMAPEQPKHRKSSRASVPSKPRRQSAGNVKPVNSCANSSQSSPRTPPGKRASSAHQQISTVSTQVSDARRLTRSKPPAQQIPPPSRSVDLSSDSEDEVAPWDRPVSLSATPQAIIIPTTPLLDDHPASPLATPGIIPTMPLRNDHPMPSSTTLQASTIPSLPTPPLPDKHFSSSCPAIANNVPVVSSSNEWDDSDDSVSEITPAGFGFRGVHVDNGSDLKKSIKGSGGAVKALKANSQSPKLSERMSSSCPAVQADSAHDMQLEKTQIDSTKSSPVGHSPKPEIPMSVQLTRSRILLDTGSHDGIRKRLPQYDRLLDHLIVQKAISADPTHLLRSFVAVVTWYLPYIGVFCAYGIFLRLVAIFPCLSTVFLLLSTLPVFHLVRIMMRRHQLCLATDLCVLEDVRLQLEPSAGEAGGQFGILLGALLGALESPSRPLLHEALKDLAVYPCLMSALLIFLAVLLDLFEVALDSYEGIAFFVCGMILIILGCAPNLKGSESFVDQRLCHLEAAMNVMLDTVRPLIGIEKVSSRDVLPSDLPLHTRVNLKEAQQQLASIGLSVRLLTCDQKTIRASLLLDPSKGPTVLCPLAHFNIAVGSPLALAAAEVSLQDLREVAEDSVPVPIGPSITGRLGQTSHNQNPDDIVSMSTASTLRTTTSRTSRASQQPSADVATLALTRALATLSAICSRPKAPIEAFFPGHSGGVVPVKVSEAEAAVLLWLDEGDFSPLLKQFRVVHCKDHILPEHREAPKPPWVSSDSGEEAASGTNPFAMPFHTESGSFSLRSPAAVPQGNPAPGAKQIVLLFDDPTDRDICLTLMQQQEDVPHFPEVL